METLRFIVESWPAILRMAGTHLSIVSVAEELAILTGVPIGSVITWNTSDPQDNPRA